MPSNVSYAHKNQLPNVTTTPLMILEALIDNSLIQVKLIFNRHVRRSLIYLAAAAFGKFSKARINYRIAVDDEGVEKPSGLVMVQSLYV